MEHRFRKAGFLAQGLNIKVLAIFHVKRWQKVRGIDILMSSMTYNVISITRNKNKTEWGWSGGWGR